MKFILGIDPGMTGAMSIIDEHGNFMVCEDLAGTDGRLNVAEAVNWIEQYHSGPFPISMAVIENVGSMPKQGVSTTFKFGRAAGTCEGMVQTLRLPMDLITPAKWKQQMKMAKKDKDYPRQWCQKRWPKVDAFDLKGKGQARADATCIALAWLELHPEFREAPSKRPPRRRT